MLRYIFINYEANKKIINHEPAPKWRAKISPVWLRLFGCCSLSLLSPVSSKYGYDLHCVYHCFGFYKALSHVYTHIYIGNFFHLNIIIPSITSQLLFPLHIVVLRITHTYLWNHSLFFFTITWILCTMKICIHYFVYTHLNCFQLLNNMDNTTINKIVYFSWWTWLKVSIGVELVACKMFKWLTLQNMSKFISKNVSIYIFSRDM